MGEGEGGGDVVAEVVVEEVFDGGDGDEVVDGWGGGGEHDAFAAVGRGGEVGGVAVAGGGEVLAEGFIDDGSVLIVSGGG